MDEKINIDSIDNLDNMRQELTKFKSMLKQQQIVNEKMMRRSMQKDYSKERKVVAWVCALMFIAIPAMALNTFIVPTFPLWFFVLTVVYLMLCVAFSYYAVRRYVSDDLMSGDIISVAEHMLAYKKLNNRWLVFFGIPSIVVWVGLFYWILSTNNIELAQMMIVSGTIGLVVGCICSVIYYISQTRRINRILTQIEELKRNTAMPQE